MTSSKGEPCYLQIVIQDTLLTTPMAYAPHAERVNSNLTEDHMTVQFVHHRTIKHTLW